MKAVVFDAAGKIVAERGNPNGSVSIAAPGAAGVLVTVGREALRAVDYEFDGDGVRAPTT
jgi:hypothetical protein